MNPSKQRSGLDAVAALKEACRREAAAARMYRALAENERDRKRADLFERLAAIEQDHARRFSEKLRELGETPPQLDFQPGRKERLMTKMRGAQATIRFMEAEEERNAELFGNAALGEGDVRELFVEIEKEEEQHAKALSGLISPNAPGTRLESILKGEKWHVTTGSWIGDAIYGMNDGLGAVFGIVLVAAGYQIHSPDPNVVLVAGFGSMVSNALSMGAGAYLASKSEREVYEAEVERERQEILENPEHEIEELELIYQLKGLSEGEAKQFARTIASDHDRFLQTMAREELGLAEHNFPNPIISTLMAIGSTALGGFIPVAPFLFTSGLNAVIWSAVVSTLAHFVVGASKTLVTGRSWLKSGTEMTIVGIIEAVLAYYIGIALGVHVGG